MALGPQLIAAPGQGLGKGFGRGTRPPLKIEHRIGIRASDEVVWEVIKDLASWPSYSPIYTRAEGQLRIGAPLSLTLVLPGSEPREINPSIIDWVPYEQILWADADWRGWVRSTRFFEIEQLGKGACIFSNGEVFEGMVSDYYARQRRRVLQAAFERHGEAVKQVAERMADPETK